jgi:hypothetical protein
MELLRYRGKNKVCGRGLMRAEVIWLVNNLYRRGSKSNPQANQHDARGAPKVLEILLRARG